MDLKQRIMRLLPTRPGESAQFKMVDGNSWAVAWSNSFNDRDGETFTKAALDDYVERTEKGEAPLPQLWVWHTPNLKIGQADFVARDGHFMLAGGTFDKTPRAQKAKAYYAEHLSEIGASHGFTYMTSDLKDKTYHKIQSVKEISLLPRKHAANLGTALLGVKGAQADGKKRAHLVAMFGEAEADRILAELADVGKAMEAVGYESKAKEVSAPAVKLGGDDGWYKPGEFAVAKQKERELLDAVQAEIEQKAGVYIHPMFGTKVYPDPPKPVVEVEQDPFWRTAVVKEKAAQRVVVNSKWFGKQAFPINGNQRSDAIRVMQKALELPDTVVIEMVRKSGDTGAFDILKASIEAQGGAVMFTPEGKK